MTEPTMLNIPTLDGGYLSAERHVARTDDLKTASGRPCVVMAHGVGATRDSGLSTFAAALATTGTDVIAFDYRHFAASSGAPRQLVSLRSQLADYHTAIGFARDLTGIDPGRIVVWGVSLSGGHVINVAADDPAVAGVISLTPAVDGLAAVVQMVKSNGVAHVVRLLRMGLRDAIAAALNHGPVLAPVVGRPGEAAALCSPGAVEGMMAIAGPTWRNAIAARIFLTIGSYRPKQAARRVACPVLMQIADHDRSAPASASTRTATRLGATVHHYPCDHFDVYPGASHYDRVIGDQVAFLRRLLSSKTAEVSR